MTLILSVATMLWLNIWVHIILCVVNVPELLTLVCVSKKLYVWRLTFFDDMDANVSLIRSLHGTVLAPTWLMMCPHVALIRD